MKEKVELQNVSVKAISESDVNTNRVLLLDIQDKNEGVRKLNEDISPNHKVCQSQLKNKVQAEIVDDVQEAGKNMKVSSSNENKNKNDVPEILSLDSVTENEKKVTELAIDSEVKAGAIETSDVTDETNVTNQVQSGTSNELHLDIICKTAITVTPSQISVAFEAGGETSFTELGGKTNGGRSITDIVDCHEQSVTMETDTSPTHDVIDGTAVCDSDTGHKGNIQNGGATSESVVIPNVANEIEREKNQNVNIENNPDEDVTNKDNEGSKELQRESEVLNETRVDLNVQQNKVADKIEGNEEDDVSLNDMVLCQPLVPQVSEAVRVGVIALVPEDKYTSVVTEESNNEVVSKENQEESDDNVDK